MAIPSPAQSDRTLWLDNLCAIAIPPPRKQGDIYMVNPRSIPELIKAPIYDVPQGKTPVRLLACGVPKGVESVINQLHVLRFAEVIAWTPPIPSPVEGEIIRILTRYVDLRR
ncbi:hypothetical protein [Moorena producens]|nr:hypothetical protein [Moorena producens]